MPGQFQDGFSAFLRFCSQELKSGGKMVLVFLGRKKAQSHRHGQLLLMGNPLPVYLQVGVQGKSGAGEAGFIRGALYMPCKVGVESEITREGSFRLTVRNVR
ncbi:hypothetical protein MLD38_030864 [Melastoma candidum]|uniref:Uncharacterized protein n=1 Tax=Melastoma candidum TaxID=119954 RepID=A0ACB9MP60_9MYRT|nr:hypothetical protein MLD38_030864 [Melastoma candidum]